MKVLRRLAVTACTLVVCAMLSTVVLAHHGRAGYGSGDTVTTMKGVVTRLMWVNPHVFVAYDVTDESGNVVGWLGEFSSVQTMLSEGMRRTSFKPGDEVLVTTRPAAGGTPHGLVIKIETVDGSVSVDLSERRGATAP